MGGLGVGVDLVRAIFIIAVIAIAIAVAIWVAVVLLAVWVVYQIGVAVWVTRAVAPAGGAHAAEASATPAFVWSRWAGTFPVVGAGLASASGALLMTDSIGLPAMLLSIAAIILIGAILLGKTPLTNLTGFAMLAGGAVAVITLIVAISTAVDAAPKAIEPEVATPYGSAHSIEEVWATVECMGGTTDIGIDPAPVVTFDDSAVVRYGQCVIYDDEDNELVYFFQSTNAAALDEWLTDGSLHVEADSADDAHVYRDGAVAIVSVDSGSNLRLYSAGYSPLD